MATGPNLVWSTSSTILRTDPTCFIAAARRPPAAGRARGARSIPLVGPTPMYAWSLLWNADRPHPRLPDLLRAFARIGARERRLDHEPGLAAGPDRARLAD